MQVRCPRCTEPWEIDVFHEVAKNLGTSFQAEYRRFKRLGCAAPTKGLNSQKAVQSSCEQTPEGLTVGAIMELCGDDPDAAACEIEDAEYLGVL